MTSIRAYLLLMTASLAAAGVAQAQTASAPPGTKTEDSSLTWKGITLYGIVDIGVQYNTHSAPYSDYFPATTGSLLQKNAYDSPVGLSSNNLSQSRIGLSGNEPLWGDWAAVFRLKKVSSLNTPAQSPKRGSLPDNPIRDCDRLLLLTPNGES